MKAAASSAEVHEKLVLFVELVDQAGLRIPTVEILFVRLVALVIAQEVVFEMALRVNRLHAERNGELVGQIMLVLEVERRVD